MFSPKVANKTTNIQRFDTSKVNFDIHRKNSSTKAVKISSRGRFIYIRREMNFHQEGISSTSGGI